MKWCIKHQILYKAINNNIREILHKYNYIDSGKKLPIKFLKIERFKMFNVNFNVGRKIDGIAFSSHHYSITMTNFGSLITKYCRQYDLCGL